MLSGSAPAMADAKIILSRKLASDWSSPELAQILEQRPGFYEEVSRVFSKLEKAIKVRRRREGTGGQVADQACRTLRFR